MKTSAVDFDGVIHDTNDVPPGRKMGPPIYGALEAVKELQSRGYKLIVHTVRATSLAGTKAVATWLEYFKFPPMSITATKPNADYYLDDKAMRFDNWEHVLGFLNG